MRDELKEVKETVKRSRSRSRQQSRSKSTRRQSSRQNRPPTHDNRPDEDEDDDEDELEFDLDAEDGPDDLLDDVTHAEHAEHKSLDSSAPTEDPASAISPNTFSQTLSNARSTIDDATRSAVTSATDSAHSIYHSTTSHLKDAITTSNDIDRSLTTTMHQHVDAASRWAGGIVFYVLKAFVLVCLVVYTFSVDTVHCRCADNVRKPIIQWGGLVTLVMVVVALVYPRVYTVVPALKVVMLLLTLVVVYAVVTYFPILRDKQCRCAGRDDWRRWVVEYSVFIVLGLFLLGIGGVSVMG